MTSQQHENLRRRARRAPHPDYETLVRYADGTLPAEAGADEVRRHLAGCPVCLEEFLFLTQELLPDLARPASLSERMRLRLRRLIERFEEERRAAGALAPLFRLTPAPQAHAAVQSAAAGEAWRPLRIDLDRDPSCPYVTILVEDERGEVGILRSARAWLNVETARAAAIDDFPARRPLRLVAVYTAAPVAAASAEEFVELLERRTTRFRLAARTLAR